MFQLETLHAGKNRRLALGSAGNPRSLGSNERCCFCCEHTRGVWRNKRGVHKDAYTDTYTDT